MRKRIIRDVIERLKTHEHIKDMAKRRVCFNMRGGHEFMQVSIRQM